MVGISEGVWVEDLVGVGEEVVEHLGALLWAYLHDGDEVYVDAG